MKGAVVLNINFINLEHHLSSIFAGLIEHVS